MTMRLHDILIKHQSDDPAALGDTHAFSAAHGVCWLNGSMYFDGVVGCAQVTPIIRGLKPEPIFDLASVTKSLVTATLTMIAVDRGWLDWDTPIAAMIPGWQKQHDTDATVLHLLNHSSGLPAWHKFYEEYPMVLPPSAYIEQRQTVIDRICTWPRDAAPGALYAYSDLGYILLCALLEHTFAKATDTCRYLNELAHDFIFEPLDMKQTRYIALLRDEAPIEDAVATEWCTYFEEVVVGVVHDENTRVMGGVSGHAGAFSTAHDLLRFAIHMLDIDRGRVEGIISQNTLQFCWSEAARGADGHHLGGWDTPSGTRSSVGRYFGRKSTVGHLGFTGTSMWIDRQKEAIAILLTNRVHPSRDNPRILDARIDFHEAFLSKG